MTSVSTTHSTAVKQQAAQPPPSIQEFSIKVPKTKKKHSVMRFNGVLKVNFKEWKNVKLERENNLRDPRDNDEEIPKFGAGSEFGREAREEARKKKFGMISRKYKSEDQPWILKVNGKSGRKFKGVREGGISDNAAYYVFTHGPDGGIEAYPLNEWYNFQIIQRYKALSAEEAEEEFNRRNKVMNYFNLMLKKRLRNDDEEGEDGDMLDGEKKKKKPGKNDKDFKISEMEDWIDSDDDNDSESDDKEDKNESGDDKKDKKKKDVKKKKKKNSSDNEAFEESDDGDEEGRELDYISDSSASESELESQKEMKSVAEEDALRKLLASDEEDDDEQSDKKDDEDLSDDEERKNKEEKEKDKAGKANDKKKDNKKKPVKKESGDSSSDAESVSETNKNKDDKKPASTQNSRAPTPTAGASTSSESLKRNRKDSPDSYQAKRVKTESNYSLPSSYSSSSSDSTGITEDAVRRYLMRKPMTTTELLQKFKSKKTGLSSEQIVVVMTKILKNINPKSQKVKDKMYFSIKSPHRQQLPR